MVAKGHFSFLSAASPCSEMLLLHERSRTSGSKYTFPLIQPLQWQMSCFIKMTKFLQIPLKNTKGRNSKMHWVVSAVTTAPHINHRHFIYPLCLAGCLLCSPVVSHQIQGVQSSGRWIDFVCVDRALIPAKVSSQAQHMKMVMVIKEIKVVIFQGKCFCKR